ncbi:MAG: hypothetical protein MJZ34_11255 [Paludibacteraceae bacterium]|nr:hypothetical protein [Paludibacteraceae bacterium]
MAGNPEIEEIHNLISISKDNASELLELLEEDYDENNEKINIAENIISDLDEAYDKTLYYTEEFDCCKTNIVENIIEVFNLPNNLDVAMFIEEKVNEIIDRYGSSTDKL